jgi:hypothetical protein
MKLSKSIQRRNAIKSYQFESRPATTGAVDDDEGKRAKTRSRRRRRRGFPAGRAQVLTGNPGHATRRIAFTPTTRETWVEDPAARRRGIQHADDAGTVNYGKAGSAMRRMKQVD